MGPNVIHPQLPGQGTQANYYWGGRPLIQNPADVNNYNTQIPASAQAYGATSAQGVGSNTINIQDLIAESLGQSQALSAYPRAGLAPVVPANYTNFPSINTLINQTLGLSQAAAGGPVAPSK